MTKLTKISLVIISIALAIGATFAIQPKTLGTSARTKTVYLDRENTFTNVNSFTATTTLNNGFVSTSTPTQAGQIVGLDASSTLPAVDGSNLTNIMPNAFLMVASDNIKYSANTERFTTEVAFTKIKEIKINKDGIIRVKYGIAEVVGQGYYVVGRTYKNGIAAGTENLYDASDSSVYGYYQDDITVQKGDLIQLYIHSQQNGGPVRCKDFSISYDLSLIENGQVIQD